MVNKGSDEAVHAVQNPDTDDDVTQYQMGRYLSSKENCWQLFGFPLHDWHPAIIYLSVHLENGQRVYFTKQWGLLETIFPLHDWHPAIINLSVHLENGQRVYFTKQWGLLETIWISPSWVTLSNHQPQCSPAKWPAGVLHRARCLAASIVTKRHYTTFFNPQTVGVPYKEQH